jgi:hypothetical protein
MPRLAEIMKKWFDYEAMSKGLGLAA